VWRTTAHKSKVAAQTVAQGTEKEAV